MPDREADGWGDVLEALEKRQNGTVEDTPTADRQVLKTQQVRAVAALAAGLTQADAADAAGVSRRTVGRWWNGDVAFRRTVGDLRTAYLDAAAGRLARKAGEIADRIVAMALEPSSMTPRDRLSACRVALTFARHTDNDLETRLTALEAVVMGAD